MLFNNASEEAGRNGLALIPWEGEQSHGLREALQIVPMNTLTSRWVRASYVRRQPG